MLCSPEELAQKERYSAAYQRARLPVMLAIERAVCGCDYGGNSWTGEREAQQLAATLRLDPAARLLDLGAGAGWPGLYMAARAHCDLVLVDLPLHGLQMAKERANRDGIAGRVSTTVANAASLPFRDGTFDAISHSDLLCCLLDKRGVLAEARRVIRDGGRMAFTVISIASGLGGEEYRSAASAGPEFVEADAAYPQMLEQAGWTILEEIALTTDFADRCNRQLAADRDHRDGLIEILGAEAYDFRLAGWKSKIGAITAGLLERSLFVVEPA